MRADDRFSVNFDRRAKVAERPIPVGDRYI